jgi:MFS family permease
MSQAAQTPAHVRIAILVAALGYFVDLFDLVLFSILRVPSLKAIGVTDPDKITAIGKRLLDLQLLGMLLGGIAFGMLGDRFGRLKTLFGSILLYSVANILNAFVTEVWQYEILRFVAGLASRVNSEQASHSLPNFYQRRSAALERPSSPWSDSAARWLRESRGSTSRGITATSSAA